MIGKLNIFKHFLSKETSSLKLLSIRSAFWSVLGKGGGSILRIAGNLILTRILFPEAFGLMATANAIHLILQLFSDTGVNLATIQNPRGDQDAFLNTAWIIKIFRGVLLGVVMLSLAWPLSYMYEIPTIKLILLIMCVSPIISGFENPALPLLIRKFRVSRQVGMEISIQVVGLTTTIVLAFLLKSVYALAIGVVVSSLYRLVFSYLVFPYRPIFRWDKNAGREIIHFGKYVFLNTMITAGVMHFDVFMIGKLLDMSNLSFYNIGKNLGTLIAMFSSSVVLQAYLPAVSSVQGDLHRVQRIYQRTTAFFLALAIPASMTIALFSIDIIELLYDPRYRFSYIPLFWFGLIGIVRIIGNISGATFFAIGKPAFETLSMAAGLLIILVFLPFGIAFGGLQGGACTMAISMALIAVIESLLLVYVIGFQLKTVLRPWGQTLLTTGICAGFFYFLRPWAASEQFGNIPFLILMGIVSMTVSGVVYQYLEGPNPFRDYSQSSTQSMPAVRMASETNRPETG
jgi:O-antigen/teichoic acid export membrane protein